MYETAYKQRIVDYLRGHTSGSEGGILAYDLYKQGWEPQLIIHNLGELNKEGSRYLLVKLNTEEQPLFFDLMDMSFLYELSGVPVYVVQYLLNNYQRRKQNQEGSGRYMNSSIITHLLNNSELYDGKNSLLTDQQEDELIEFIKLQGELTIRDRELFKTYLENIVIPQELTRYKGSNLKELSKETVLDEVVFQLKHEPEFSALRQNRLVLRLILESFTS